MRQLASGVAAIHAHGKLHRDIKPSNVMVARSGRVVILDFGVVGEFRREDRSVRLDETHRGYAGVHVARAGGVPTGHACLRLVRGRRHSLRGADVSHALRGDRRPSCCSPSSTRSPPARAISSTGIPPDLEQLCVDLLQLDPRARPAADEIIRRLEGDTPPTVSASVEVPFVGRRLQLGELHARLRGEPRGTPVIVMLHGRSGMGKSALAARFLGQIEARPDALVLSGRCYDREAVPFKAVDQVVDELSRWLGHLSDDDAIGLLPDGVRALARLFPVIANARVVAESPDRDAEVDRSDGDAAPGIHGPARAARLQSRSAGHS